MSRGKPYLVGHQEFAALYRVDPKQVAQWLSPSRGSVLDPETAIVVSGVRYWPLGFAAGWGATTARFRQVDLDVKARIIAEQGEGWEPGLGDELPPIVGQQEIIELFHLPAQGNLATTIATGRFPEHDWLLSGSMLWMLDTVLDAVPKLRERARSLPWDVDEEVVAALRDGTYDGPGSRVLTRGRHARKAL
ncbi:hypothetical protein [Streptomyces sp. SAJ15]|uniref:hypothetical protein n=1 Tax=Streptomyces sp. SAJ15 TaxID=2011095 RepID=UPI0011855276|nr:hypothetical protein [Streptomyces sp. SAJ15]TVL92023.1 hypothetical protein CD790_15275 [Streptomyces sp. SAJ15]